MKPCPFRLIAAALAVLIVVAAVPVFAEEDDWVPIEEINPEFDWEAAGYTEPPAPMMGPAVNPQRAASEAAQMLYESFEWVDGNYIYPPEFAGLWLDGAELHVALTTDDEAVLERYAAIMGNPDFLHFELHSYPLRVLFFYQHAGMRAAAANGAAVHGAGVDQQRNRVEIGVDEADIAKVWDNLHGGIGAATVFGTGVPLLRVDDVFDVVAAEPNQLHTPD